MIINDTHRINNEADFVFLYSNPLVVEESKINSNMITNCDDDVLNVDAEYK